MKCLDTPLTVKLHNGREVLAKLYKGEPSALLYANRAQALRKAIATGPRWDVFRGLGRPFYVGRVDEPHPLNMHCPICARPGDIFGCVHVQGPPCVQCRTILEFYGTREHPFWRCPTCKSYIPVEDSN